MEFWGAEVKHGQTLEVVPGEDMVLHLSQACLGEMKKDKGNESVCLFVNVDGKKLVLGTLFSEKLPQQQFDLVFDKNFELSHNWKNGSVYFYGYKANNPYEEESQGDESDESDEEDIPLVAANNVKPEVEAKPVKPAEADKASASKSKQSDAGKQKVKIVEPIKDVNSEDDDTSEDAMSEDEDDSEEEVDEDDSEDSDESDEETPTPKKKPESSKKRAADSAVKTPVQDKKAKVTPQKADGKKVSGHVATPHPAKQAGKTPASKQTPQSGGSVSCKSCSRAFGSEKALESHTKAKHSASK